MKNPCMVRFNDPQLIHLQFISYIHLSILRLCQPAIADVVMYRKIVRFALFIRHIIRTKRESRIIFIIIIEIIEKIF